MKLLALDPGINLGWALMDSRAGLLKYGTFRSPKSERHAALADYSAFIRDCLADGDGNPDETIQAIACEEVLAGSHRLRSQEAVFWLLGTYFAAGQAAAVSGIRFATYAPATVKKHIAGRGGASKEEVIAAVAERYGVALNRLESHAADAIGLGDCFLSRLAVAS